MSDSLNILVYGATGAQGQPIVQKLLQKNYRVRVFARDRDKARSLFPETVEIEIGTLEDRASLNRANQGVDRVFLVLPLEYRVDVAMNQGRQAIDAAREAGVRLLVFNTSTFIPPQVTDAAAFEIKRDLERYLKQSGVPSIVLRPTVYMDNFAAPWSLPNIVGQNVVAYPIPAELKVAWISLDDTAALGVAALERPELAGSAFDLGGAVALSGKEIAARFSQVLERSLTYQEIPIDGFEQGLNQAFGEPTGTEIAKIYRWRAAHPEANSIDMSAVLQQLPIQLTTLEQWIRRGEWANP
jgi:NAD(P)H dehydrogenase (quinone)